MKYKAVKAFQIQLYDLYKETWKLSKFNLVILLYHKEMMIKLRENLFWKKNFF